jgi:hypothetical protein
MKTNADIGAASAFNKLKDANSDFANFKENTWKYKFKNIKADLVSKGTSL